MNLKKRKIVLCKIRTCTNDESTYNTCRQRKTSDKIDRIEFGPKIGDGEEKPIYYNDVLYSRLFYWRLLQGEKPQLPKIILSDILVYLTFISIYTSQIGNLIRKVPWASMTSTQNLIVPNNILEYYKVLINSQNVLLTPLLSLMKLTFYLMNICDKDTAKIKSRDI